MISDIKIFWKIVESWPCPGYRNSWVTGPVTPAGYSISCVQKY